jgi:hypothetical protein
VEADRLLQSLLNGNSESEWEIEESLNSLHKFSIAILDPQPEGDGWTCPIRCYLAARGIRKDGNFIPPEVLTPRLAMLKYFCTNCALVQAEQAKGSTTGGMIE